MSSGRVPVNGPGLARTGLLSFTVAAAGFGTAIAAAALVPSLPGELAALTVAGFFSTAFMAAGSTTLQLTADPQFRGRVMAPTARLDNWPDGVQRLHPEPGTGCNRCADWVQPASHGMQQLHPNRAENHPMNRPPPPCVHAKRGPAAIADSAAVRSASSSTASAMPGR
jgi:hypothetical protein